MINLKISVEESLRNRIVYVGNEIPEAVANDKRDKFVLLGYPQQVIDETTNRAPDPRVEKLVAAIKDYLAIKASPEDRPERGKLVSLAAEHLRWCLVEYEKEARDNG